MENFNTKEILAILLKNKKAIIIVTILAALVSTIASFLLKPMFKSNAVVYPVNISPNSEESNTEQLLQYFNSEQVMEAVAKKFDLYHHYAVDTTSEGYKSLFKFYYNSNIKISPTLYESVDIEIHDESPQMARNIAQGLIDATNSLIFEIRRDRLAEYIQNSSAAITKEANDVDSLNAKIMDIRIKHNIIDVASQSKYISKKLVSGKPLTQSDQNLISGLKYNSTDLEKLWSLMNGQLKTVNDFLNQRDKYLLEYNSHLSFINVVSKPSLADKKYFPVRWVIVSISTLSAIALACLFFILTNKSTRKVD